MLSLLNYHLTVMFGMNISTKRGVWLILVVIIFTTTACTSAVDEPTELPTSRPSTQESSPTATLGNHSPYFFPLQDDVEGERAVMEGEIFGTLALDNNCIRVKDNEADTGHLLIWPPDFSLRVESGEIQIRDEDDHVAAIVGDRVQIGGGEIHLSEMLSDTIKEQIPPHCLPPFWIVGDEISVIEPAK